jgi:2-polyprenyl-6-methoxyphenol hydroxylase-like FAD-dependent oxidoreductase
VKTDVLVVGAGPVGLTLALDLARRGVRVLLVEKREQPLRLPKMERSNPRTMEIWRRLGVMDEIRAAGLPAHMPMDVVIVRNLVEAPLVRQVYLSVTATRERIAATNDGSMPREPYQLVSQFVVEPILLARAQRTANIEVRQGVELIGLQQDDQGVTARMRDSSGEISEVRCRYLVGCDGGGSTVRKELGIQLQGDAGIGTIFNIFFRCDDFVEKSRVGFARHYCFAGLSAGGGAGGTIVIQGDLKHLAMHIMTEPPADPASLLRDVTGLDIHPQVLHAAPWVQHMLVAERHMHGRVFLAGDANHIYIPAGGLGMNTGIGDAVNLAWKLAAALQGWGGPHLLESYHAERSATAHRNRDAARWAVEGVVGWRSAFTPKILENSPEGREARAHFLEIAEAGNRRVYEMHGADLGYRYVSAVIDASEGPAPASPITEYEPSTWPGAHLPHVWVASNESIYELLSNDAHTLLALGKADHDVAGLQAAFRAFGAPIELMRSIDPQIRRVYGSDLILVRPDLHVAWRGDRPPGEPAALAARVTGHVNSSPSQ